MHLNQICCCLFYRICTFLLLDDTINVAQEVKQEKLETEPGEEDSSHFVSNSKMDSFDLDSYSLSEEEFFDCLGKYTFLVFFLAHFLNFAKNWAHFACVFVCPSVCPQICFI